MTFLIALVAGITVVTVVIAILATRSTGGDRATDGLGPITLNAQEQHGRQVFAQHCAGCHELKASNAVGSTGPSLDMLRPPAPATLAAIRHGPGAMPADLVTGPDAQAVANFVAAVTAH
jgi:mono/diheme cytochrome c family protein